MPPAGDGEYGSGRERGMERAERGNGMYGDYLHRVENMPIMGVRENGGGGVFWIDGLCCRCGEVTYLSMIPAGCLFRAQSAREGQVHSGDSDTTPSHIGHIAEGSRCSS